MKLDWSSHSVKGRIVVKNPMLPLNLNSVKGSHLIPLPFVAITLAKSSLRFPSNSFFPVLSKSVVCPEPSQMRNDTS